MAKRERERERERMKANQSEKNEGMDQRIYRNVFEKGERLKNGSLERIERKKG